MENTKKQKPAEHVQVEFLSEEMIKLLSSGQYISVHRRHFPITTVSGEVLIDPKNKSL